MTRARAGGGVGKTADELEDGRAPNSSKCERLPDIPDSDGLFRIYWSAPLHHRLRRHATWPLRLVVVSGLFFFALVHGVRRRDRSSGGIAAAAVRGPRPLALDDADQDGLPDTLEAALAARFAPAVILDPHEANRPASIAWLLSRIGGVGHLETVRGGFPADVRAGSADPRDWVTYVHVYPRTDGHINVQYWFFYPYNDGPFFFDHDADWEHVTIDVDRSGVPARRLLRAAWEQQPGRLSRLERDPQVGRSDRRAPARALGPRNPRQLRRSGFARLVRARQRLRRGRALRRSDLADLGGGRPLQPGRARGPPRSAGGAGLCGSLGQSRTLSPLEIGPARTAPPARIFERRIRLIGGSRRGAAAFA